MAKQTFILGPDRKAVLEAIQKANDGQMVTIGPAGRSIPQNSMSHGIYEQIAKELPEDSALGWKCFCKLHFGVMILRSEDEEFRQAYDSCIKGLTYEQKLEVMKVLPVTSRMNKEQKSRYMDAVIGHFLERRVRL